MTFITHSEKSFILYIFSLIDFWINGLQHYFNHLKEYKSTIYGNISFIRTDYIGIKKTLLYGKTFFDAKLQLY